MPPAEYAKRLDKLKELGDMQAECARKAAFYRRQDLLEMAGRFERASLAATNARMFMHAAFMAEREVPAV